MLRNTGSYSCHALIHEFKSFRRNGEKAVFLALHQIFVGLDAQYNHAKAANDDVVAGVVTDNVICLPANTGIFGNQLLDALEALRVFGVPLDRTDAVPFVIISHCDFSFFGVIYFRKMQA